MADAPLDLATLGVAFVPQGAEELDAAMKHISDSGSVVETLLGKITGASHDASSAAKAHAEALVDADKSAGGFGNVLVDVSEKIKSFTDASGLGQRSLAELGHSFKAVADETIATGTPFRALGEEAPRVAEALGGAGNAMKLLGSFITPATVGIAAFVGVLAAAVTAVVDYNKHLQENTNLSVEFGRFADATGQDFSDMASRVAASSDITVGAARTSIATFAQAGDASADTIEKLAGTVSDYAELTGTKFADANKELATAISDPKAAAEDFQEKLGILSGAELEQIDNLIAMGDKAGASALLADKLSESQKKAADAAGLHKNALQQMGAAFSAFWNWIGQTDKLLDDGSRRWADYWLAAAGDKEAIDDIALLKRQEAEQKSIRINSALNKTATAPLEEAAAVDPTGVSKINDMTNAVVKYSAALDADTQYAKANGGQHTLTAEQIETYRHAIEATKDTQSALLSSTGELTVGGAKYLSIQQAQHLAAEDETKAKLATDDASKKYYTTQASLLKQAYDVETQTERQTKADDAGAASATKAKKAKQDASENLIAKLTAEVDTENKAIASYDGSESAIIAETAAKAASQAISEKKATATQAETIRQLELAKATDDYIITVQKAASQEQDRADVASNVYGQVAKGTLAYADANQAIALQTKLLPMLDEQAALANDTTAEGIKRYDALSDAIQDITESTQQYNQTVADAALDKQNADLAQQNQLITAQTALIGASNVERAAQLAQLNALKTLGNTPGEDTDVNGNLVTLSTAYANLLPKQKAFVDGQVNAQVATVKFNEATAESADQFKLVADRFDQMNDRIQDGVSGLGDAFGSFGKTVGSLASIFGNLADTQEKNNRALLQYQQQAHLSNDQLKTTSEYQRTQLENQTALEAAFGKSLTAAQSYFKEGSTGYEVLGAASSVYHALELAQSIASIASHAAETESAIANGIAQATGWAPAAIMHAFAELGPIAGAVAVAGILAEVGIGLSGGGTTFTPTAVDTRNTGTGTSGDATTQSQSLQKSLDNANKYQDQMLDYSSQQVTALQAIEDGISSLTVTLGRSITASGGTLDVSGVKTGTTTTPAILGLFGGSSKTTSLQDNGLNFTAQNLNDIIANGVKNATSYIDVQTTKTSSGFLGIGGGTKTSDAITSQALDSDISTQISQVLGSLKSGVLQAAGQLGIEGASAALDSFTVNLGKISFKGMTADQIQTQLNAVFSAVGDNIAQQAVGWITQFSKVGEGALETLERVATDYGDVNDKLTEMGQSFYHTGIMQNEVTITEGLVNMAGGIDKFNSQADFFTQNFLTAAQQIAPIATAVQKQLDSMGLSAVKTTAQFADVVRGLDLGTQAGDDEYTQLMALAPAFKKVADYNDTLNGTITDTSDLLAKRIQLEIDLANAQGDTATATALSRQQTLASTDDSLKALQQQVFDATDATAAQKALSAAQAAAAQTAADLASKQNTLQQALFTAQGNTAAATALQRQATLAATDDSLKGLQQQVFDAQDAAAAQDALAKAQADAATAAQAAADATAKAQADAASAAATAAKTLASAQQALASALGDTTKATAIQRQGELAAITDPQVRSLTLATYAASDLTAAYTKLTAAQSAAASATSTAASALVTAQNGIVTAYNTQASSINSTISALQSLDKQLSGFLDTVGNADLSPQNAYSASQAKFNQDVATGNTTDLTTDAQAFLTASKTYNASGDAYQKDLSAVKSAVSAADNNVKGQISVQQQTLDAITRQASALVNLNGSQVTLQQAIANYYKAQNDLAVAKAAQDQANANAQQNVLTQVLQALMAQLGQTGALGQEQLDALRSLADSLAATARQNATITPVLNG